MPALITPADSLLATSIVFDFPDDGRLEFQYPPKILSDNRKGNWEDIEGAPGQTEPIVVYASSSARELSMQITYIYDGVWNCDRITKQVRLLRGYFQRVRNLNQQRNLVIKLKLWCIGGNDPELMSFRMKSCDVKYSETMIFQNDPNKAFPLRTDITCDLAVWTQSTGDQKLERLEKDVTPSWY